VRPALAALGGGLVAIAAVVAASELSGLLHGEWFETAPTVSREMLVRPAIPAGGDDRTETGAVMPAVPPASIQPAEEGSAPLADAPAVTEPEPAPDSPAPAAHPMRQITGPGITPGPTVSGPLQREAVPPKAPKPPEAARWQTFSRVVVLEPGMLDIGKRHVRLAGIVSPDGERPCEIGLEGAAEATQPCARLAVAALRQRIRAFGVQCDISMDDPADPPTVPCRIGKTDLALWLVDQGWAEAAGGAPEPYQTAEIRARCAHKGLWRSTEPPPSCPAP
jgi:endonuclease YncB( thermonuclease family)